MGNLQDVAVNERHQQYWRANIKILSVLLTIWFVVSYGCGILFVKQLNQFQFAGFKVGFWFAQQGSMIIFVLLIVAYIFLMNKLDKKFDVDEK